jgi:hypothetical protein
MRFLWQSVFILWYYTVYWWIWTLHKNTVPLSSGLKSDGQGGGQCSRWSGNVTVPNTWSEHIFTFLASTMKMVAWSLFTCRALWCHSTKATIWTVLQPRTWIFWTWCCAAGWVKLRTATSYSTEEWSPHQHHCFLALQPIVVAFSTAR